jgi:hypothetical protein
LNLGGGLFRDTAWFAGQAWSALTPVIIKLLPKYLDTITEAFHLC